MYQTSLGLNLTLLQGSIVGTQKLLDALGESSVTRFILTCSLGAFFKRKSSSQESKKVKRNAPSSRFQQPCGKHSVRS